MQTFISRMGDLVKGLLVPVGQHATDDASTDSTTQPDRRDGEGERLPERDESYYWAMHAHW